MGSKAGELAREQAYFDLAHKQREQSRAALDEATRAAAHGGAAAGIRRDASALQSQLGSPGDQVAFGRFDHEDGERWYVGSHLILDDEKNVLVINWKLPAAAPFYKASHRDPLGVTLKRTFECTGNTIDDFVDVLFSQVALDGDGPDGSLLRELSRSRTGHLRSIVATIQAAQYDLIRAPLDQVLVIEGGPGTGKTAIALHRVTWLLYNHPDRLRAADILVVGPNPTFTHYIRTVLPALGEQEVLQRDISLLAPDVRRGRPEALAVARIKGDAGMATVLARALRSRVGSPESAERLQIGSSFLTLPGADVAQAVVSCKNTPGPYAQRRARLRDLIIRLVEERGGHLTGGNPSLDNLVERLWPQLTPQSLLSSLFGSRDRLLAAAGDDYSAEEIMLLRRRSADRLSEEVWSRDDLPLLDEAAFLINGQPERFAHIVVDEAQDLSPMQLRSIARRSSTGSLTVVGDIAQSTGVWARDAWDDVLASLPETLPASVQSLRYGYRVPRQLYEFAAQLLPIAAPGVTPPVVVRDGPALPGIHRVDPDERAGRAVSLALAHSEEFRFVGIICTGESRVEVETALAANGVVWSSADRGELGRAINLVSPHEAKGLEFDAVIVVEPEEIVADDERGHRLLYVALTRTVGYLDIVCVGDPLPLRPVTPGTEPETETPFDPALIEKVAAAIALRIRAQVPPAQHDDVLAELRRLLQE
ncbi:DNA helicase IV [Allocatelliglobosispora scoriae]|uniref:DNA helicase IV n=1 Tax=Allocatelliglobosispora scoriae TaxID=643052 RepID=A0A841BJR7_9ACTN|nr:UvrD-helicase domain-containing protein [Allocatelliglobosispora scoriae]MBB5867578.1 DNA helicase IV [Allocatelliglobosispora scoriae]